ncbi:MAG: tetratricopeptide repeat protein [Tateyamaria sp.]|nr:tetratricopeptide repeat protein [Tateyamaria sp.]
MLDSGTELALLDGDAARAAALILRRADHDAGGRADFAALSQVQDDYYVASRDKGVALDLRVSIALANLLVDRAGDSDETGAALNNLGIALATLGERDSGTERLEQAVEAFQQALKEYTRDRVPLDWAATQKNLGTALQTLGARDSDTDRLEQAVEAYQQALKERTRDRVPLDWAMTRYNWAITELTLFEKTAQAAHLDRAQDLLRTAAAEFAAAGASHYVDMAAGLQAKIDAARAVRSRRLGAGRFKC